MDWGKGVRGMKEIVVAILIAAVIIAVEVSGIPKGAIQINEYQKGQANDNFRRPENSYQRRLNYLSQKRKDILDDLKAHPEKHGCPLSDRAGI